LDGRVAAAQPFGRAGDDRPLKEDADGVHQNRQPEERADSDRVALRDRFWRDTEPEERDDDDADGHDARDDGQHHQLLVRHQNPERLPDERKAVEDAVHRPVRQCIRWRWSVCRSRDTHGAVATQQLFLLSPAYCGGRRAAILLNPASSFDLAVRLRAGDLTLGEAFSFLSGLYFRGKLAYAERFGALCTSDEATLVITPSGGLRSPRAIVTAADLG